MLTLLTLAAFAGATDSEVYVPRPLAGRPVLDLRIGADTVSSLDAPVVCLEGYPLAWLSLEGCGTGANLWHIPTGPELSHYRTRVRALKANDGRIDAELLVGLGFAEVQVGQDQAGFLFGQAREEDQVEASGAEGSVSGKVRWWTGKTYMVMDLNVGAAVIPANPVVTGATGPILGFGGVSVGAGF
ncbi:MAG: hypothetical protein EP330_19275 [Deltaproteobacteria bacterium]|nr:MAG: hypothetical protein EP330_19275 [Deltaproteobacteria bacterium]